jgi:hypothetical protein
MLGSVVRWVLKTLWKWGDKTDMLSKALVARVPSGKRIAIVVFCLWCADSPFASRQMCSHARHGSMRMSWIFEQTSAYQTALACNTACAM